MWFSAEHWLLLSGQALRIDVIQRKQFYQAISMNHRKIWKSIKSNKVIILINIITLITLATLIIYVKLSSNNVPVYWIRTEFLSDLFTDCFSRERPYFGAFNKVIEVLWGGCLATCLIGVGILHKYRQLHPGLFSFWVHTACILSFIMADDLFRGSVMLNLYLGIPKILPRVIYGLLIIHYFWSIRLFLERHLFILIGMSLSFILLSESVDLLALPGRLSPIILEDGPKLLGLTNLACVLWLVAQDSLNKKITRQNAFL